MIVCPLSPPCSPPILSRK
jgi:deoxyribose-phosphate aldolase